MTEAETLVAALMTMNVETTTFTRLLLNGLYQLAPAQYGPILSRAAVGMAEPDERGSPVARLAQANTIIGETLPRLLAAEPPPRSL